MNHRAILPPSDTYLLAAIRVSGRAMTTDLTAVRAMFAGPNSHQLQPKAAC
jgi:hypothetical protein